MRRWLGAGAMIYGTGVAATYVYYRYTSSSSSPSDTTKDFTVPPTELERQDTFDKNSSHYDKDIDDQEWLSGIDNLRKDLVKHIHGNYILEMGIGTGRNFTPLKQSYPYAFHSNQSPPSSTSPITNPINSLGFLSDGTPTVTTTTAPRSIGLYTGIDFSIGMLTIAKQRAQSLGYTVIPVSTPYLTKDSSQVRIPLPSIDEINIHRSSNSSSTGIPVMLIPYNISNGLPFDDGKFDIIIDTFGLCSYENPVFILREMKRCLRQRSNDEIKSSSTNTTNGTNHTYQGKILLLEHGRSEWEWLSQLLDKSSLNHAHKHGCYWNRNIDELIKEAGLTVHTTIKKQGGTVRFLIVS